MPRPLLRALRLAATFGLLALLWHLSDGAAALDHLGGARPGWLAAALLALSAQTLLSALRWHLTADRLGVRFDRVTALREYYLAQLLNQALPGGVLGDAGRALRVRAGAGLMRSTQAVLFERLAGQIALLALFGAGTAGTLIVPGGLAWPDRLLVPALLVLGGGLGLPLLLGLAARRHRPGADGTLAAFGNAFLHAVAAREVRVPQALLSLGTALCNVAAFTCCAAAVGVQLPPATALALTPLILFTMLVPLTVGGWGLREGAAAALLPLAGATHAEGLAASVAFGLAVVVAALPGLLALGSASDPVPVPVPRRNRAP